MKVDKETTQLAGDWIGYGFLNGVYRWLFWPIVLVLVTTAMVSHYRPRDATDTPLERSGMALRTDHGTGCEYLESRTGMLTPRLKADGTQEGCR